MSIYTDCLKEFRNSFKAYYNNNPSLDVPKEVLSLRLKLIQEELLEFIQAIEEKNLENTAKELADLLYVVFGAADAFGLIDKIDLVFQKVHISNMSKLDENGMVITREDGKILKSKKYKPVDLNTILD
jgi:predicted HAD superfamily Cof-like phosphohydrolase